MIKAQWAVLVRFHCETVRYELINELLLSEHLIIWVVRYSLKRYPDASLPGLERQILKKKFTMDLQGSVHFS